MQTREAATHIFHSLAAHLKIKVVLSTIFGFVVYSVGDNRIVIEVLLYLIIIDWLLGVTHGIKSKTFSSWKLSRILFKLFFYLMLLIMSYQATRLAFFPNWFDDLVVSFIALTEIKSILENAALLGWKRALIVEKKLNEFLEDKFKV